MLVVLVAVAELVWRLHHRNLHHRNLHRLPKNVTGLWASLFLITELTIDRFGGVWSLV